MHAFLHKSRRENHRRVVFTQQDTIYSRAHLVLTNLLITSLLVLCFSQWFLLFMPPNILLISCHPRLLFWYLLFRYRWAHHLCFLSMNDLSRSSFFDLSTFFFSSFFFLLFYFLYIFIQYGSRRFPGSFSLIISPNSGFSFCYVSSMAFFLKRHFRRHACISTQK